MDCQALNEQFEWIRALKDCPQDPIDHAKGDVWIHLKMVRDALVGSKEWPSLNDVDRDLLFTATLLNEVAEPSYTRLEGGRISSRGHSQRGAIQARQILWVNGAGIERREHVSALVRVSPEAISSD